MTPQLLKIGVECPLELLPDLGEERVLEDFEGPLLTMSRGVRSGEVFLRSWCDADADYNRWILLRSTDRDLARYIKRRINLRELLMAARDGLVWLIDTAAGDSPARAFLCRIERIPESYLPSEGSFYHEDESPHRADREEWTLLLQGTWTLDDLQALPRSYVQVYSAVYLFGERAEALEQRPCDFGKDIAFGKGGAARSLYNKLADAVPANARPVFRRISVASPGNLTLELERRIADQISQLTQDHRSERATCYDALYRARHPKSRTRSGSSLEDPFDEEPIPWDPPDQMELPIEDSGSLEHLGRRICPLVGLLWDRVAGAFPDLHHRTDFILAHCRRLAKLDSFLERGLVEAL
ncbi:MAG: hypothetical protein IPK80_23215 [Nannocystis sp.]|nr:hypothetical protein [Nannocystis sp.]